MAFSDYTASIEKNKGLRDNIRKRHFITISKKLRYSKTTKYVVKKDDSMYDNYVDGNSFMQIIQNDYPWIIFVLVIFTIVINYLTT